MDICDKCVFFISSIHKGKPSRCVLHQKADDIKPGGWCEYFLEGRQWLMGYEPLNLLTKKESGYVDDARESMEK